MIALNKPSIKTIYIGGHDGQKWGETPTFKCEPEPIRANLTHSQLVRIVNRAYREAQFALADELNVKPSNEHSDNGVWP